METTAVKPGFIDVGEAPAGDAAHPSAGKNCQGGAPTGAPGVRADAQVAIHSAGRGTEGGAHRIPSQGL